MSGPELKPEFKVDAWGYVAIAFVLLALVGYGYSGLRYVFDDEYRHQKQMASRESENSALARQILENRLRWKLNGCDVPGLCNDMGYRLDGSMAGTLKAQEIARDAR